MQLYVITGQSGDRKWAVTAVSSEIQASIFCEVANGIADACIENLKAFQRSEAYQAASISDKMAVNRIIMGPAATLDETMRAVARDSVKYTYTAVAIHD
jgi:hypothetical protein